MNLQFVNYSSTGRIATITINRPDKRNAMNAQLISELRSAFKLAEDDHTIRAIILKANGEVFSAGADLDYLKKLRENSFEENLADSRHMKDLFLHIHTHPKIVIAQVEGHAIAGGTGLSTVCDFIFAVPEAKFGYTEVKLGFMPAIVMVFLIRKIGEAKARELLLTGKLIEADNAHEIGLINFVSSKEKIAEDVLSFAEKIISTTSSESIKRTKMLIAAHQHMSLEDALEFACLNNAQIRETDDFKRGISSFLDKEQIIW